jgi:hypothetical protein
VAELTDALVPGEAAPEPFESEAMRQWQDEELFPALLVDFTEPHKFFTHFESWIFQHFRTYFGDPKLGSRRKHVF